ncbi:MAG: energy transducer TonB [Flavobacteriales bacterium]|nr:energy transducer TonB [Flavobacteriales bacterium]
MNANIYKLVGFSLVLLANTCCFAQTHSLEKLEKKPIEHFGCMLENMPKYPGGETELFKFIAENFSPLQKYGCLDGAIYVRFTVKEDGAHQDFECLKCPSEIHCEKAIEILKQMPKWEPAEYMGEPVNCQMVLPIRLCCF